MIDAKWFPHHKPCPQANMRLFCFPYAGGRAATFHAWSKYVPDVIDWFAVELPGHGVRLNEPLYNRMTPLVEKIAAVIYPLLEQPFAFFGHSMGALIAFELSRLLQQQYQVFPAYLFISGCRAPRLMGKEQLTVDTTLADDDFLRRIQELEGTPQEVFDIPELIALILPILKADFTLLEKYQYVEKEPLKCPIFAFGGMKDQLVSRKDLMQWNQYTDLFTWRLFPGGHFFVNDAASIILKIISQSLIHTLSSERNA